MSGLIGVLLGLCIMAAECIRPDSRHLLESLGSDGSARKKMMEALNNKYRHPCDHLRPLHYVQIAQLPRFTETGYKPLLLPSDLEARTTKFWMNNRDRNVDKEGETGIIPFDKTVRGNTVGPLVFIARLQRDLALYKALQNFIKGKLEQWTGTTDLQPTALYGVREYTRGAKLKFHVDHYRTHVLSAIVLFGQRGMDKPWPLQVYAHGEEVMRNVSMGMGGPNVVLYESATLVHGRERPLEGDGYANAFVHFSPPGWNAVANFTVTRIAQELGVDDKPTHKLPPK
eukprot:TRINITY_DN17965_c0_g1_i1.p1 TRINITY_DN17965_c0_g1~~TRINITY_DN17965_c0_g1_i1.p1  ORF type:complete len:285 (+),score=34.86 TRINITY_DN17965_c0_g1_i1:64-918(+)